MFRLVLALTSVAFLSSCSFYNYRKGQLGRKFRHAGLKEEIISLENGDINCWHGGSGIPFVMVHGFGGDAMFNWYEQMDSFPKDYYLVTPDLVYFGASTSKKDEYSIDFQAKTIIQLMDRLGIKKFHLMGISYGGMISLKIATDFPERVLKLVIVDSPGTVATKEDEQKILDMFGAKSSAEIFVPDTPKDLPRLMNIAYYKTPLVNRFGIWLCKKDVYKKMFASHSEEKKKLLEHMGEDVFKEFKSNIHVPHETLIVWGRHDTLFPPDIAFKLKKILDNNARVEIIEETAHAPNMEKPKEFNRLIMEFLGSEVKD